MKRKIIRIFIGMMLVLTACGCGKETDEESGFYVDEWEDEEEEEGEEEEKQRDELEKESPDDTQGTSDKKKKSKFLQIQVANRNSYETIEDVYSEYGYTTLCNVSWQNLILDESSAEEYPKLAEVLVEKNRQMDESYENIKEDLLASAMEIYEYSNQYYTPLDSSSTYCVERADEHILSIREDVSDYWGGAHGMYGSTGINYDVNTGEELRISDVLTSIDELPAILSEKIIYQYPEESGIFDTLEETLESYPEEKYSWTMGYEGITFYFQPYEIAYYAMGLIKATIRFDEMPEIFQREYTRVPEEGYFIPLSMYQELELDLNAEDGKKNYLWLSEYYDSSEEIEYGFKRVSITLDDEIYVDSECYALEIWPYLVSVGESRNKKYYLYIETVAENDYKTLSVYDLNQDEIVLCQRMYSVGFSGIGTVKEGVYLYYRYVPNNPGEIRLETRMDILGTWFGVKTYAVNAENGMLESDKKYYEISQNTLATTSVIPLEVVMLPLRNKKELPAGTNFYAIRTDGETYVDMRLDNGSECRIYVERDEWNLKINGVDQYECFEMLWYAG